MWANSKIYSIVFTLTNEHCNTFQVLHMSMSYEKLLKPKIFDILLFAPASARSYKIGVVGNTWFVGWLVGNAVFSETALWIFSTFCMKLGGYKCRKVAEPDF